MDGRMPVFPVHHHLPEFAQTHVHWVGDAIQPSHPLLPPSPLAFNFSQHQGLFQWPDSFFTLLPYIWGSSSNLTFSVSMNGSSWNIHFPYHSALFKLSAVFSYISLDIIEKERLKLVSFISAVFPCLCEFHLCSTSFLVHLSSFFTFVLLVPLMHSVILEIWHRFPLLICK